MKKSKIMAVALATAITVMGSGYAYWTQDLTITSTVDTGMLEVNFENPANVLEEDTDQGDAEARPTIDKHGMVIKWEDVYPGAENILEFNLANKGTLEAFVSNFTIINQKDSNGTEFPITNAILCKGIELDGTPVANFNGTLQDALEYLNDLNNKEGISLKRYNKNKAYEFNTNGNPVLSSDGTTPINTSGRYDVTKFKFILQFDPLADNVDNDILPEDKEFEFEITANVYQFNDSARPKASTTANN